MTIELDRAFDNTGNSLLIIAIEGSPESIERTMMELARGLPEKPIQGVYIRANDTTQVITPVWNGKKY